MSNNSDDKVTKQHHAKSRPATVRRAKAEVANILNSLLVKNGIKEKNIEKMQILPHDEKVKKGPIAPTSGSGSPRSRQRLPQPSAGHEVTRPAEIRHPLPPLPKGLTWPQGDYDSTRPEFGKPGGIIRYLDEVWKPLIAMGLIDMPTLREHYPGAAQAIDNYRNYRQKGRKLPKELDVPTLPEMNDRALASEWVQWKDVERLRQARFRRVSKPRKAASPHPS